DAEATTLSAGAPGFYNIGDIPTPASYTLTFTLDGYRTETRSVTLGSGGPVSGVDMVLTSSVGTLAGTVSVDSVPTGGLTVVIGDGQDSFETKTESGSGAYRFARIAPGSYTIAVFPPDGSDPLVQLVSVEPATTTVVDIDLVVESAEVEDS